MSVTFLLSYLLIAVFFGACGATAGILIGRRFGSKAVSSAEESADSAKEALRRIQRIAESMASDLHSHQSVVSAADSKLKGIDLEEDGIEALVDIVADLMENNARIQHQLSEAETKLDQLAREMISHQEEARTDALTGCANRRAFDEELAELHLAYHDRGVPFTLVMLDIDHFKRVNDEHGHGVGDEVLRMMGRVLRNHVRGADIVSRYGGEEFAILMPGVTVRQACFAAESLRTVVASQVVSFPNGALKVTASFGVAATLEGDSAEDVKRRSDDALYSAKNAGRNCVYWHDGDATHSIEDEAAFGLQGAPTETDRGDELLPTIVLSDDPQALPMTVASESLDPQKFDREIIHNLPTKTELCQDVRRRIAEWQRGGTIIAVTLIELANREKIEKQHGMQAVAALLGAIANVVQQTVRDMDQLARYTPTSLAILMPKARERDAIFICERIRKALQETHVRLYGERLPLEVHFASVEVSDGDDMQGLLSRATQRLADARRGLVATSGNTA